jgi:hypothetical protein
MTLAIAWIRKLKDCEELLFASDSRVNDGRNFDATPKVLTLPRSDCAIAFAGYTGHGFPMMLQLSIAIGSYEPARRGTIDLSTIMKHALKVFDGMAKLIESSPLVSAKQETAPEAEFIFGGYSWVKKTFQIWSLKYSTSEKRFVQRQAPLACYLEDQHKVVFSNKTQEQKVGRRSIGKIAFAGDHAQKARKLFASRLAASIELNHEQKGIDMEPFTVLRDMLRLPELRDPSIAHTMGGAPQLVKVYQYMQTVPLGVYWPEKKTGMPHLQGRPCLAYEQIDRWILDPDTLTSHSLFYSPRDLSDALKGDSSGSE